MRLTLVLALSISSIGALPQAPAPPAKPAGGAGGWLGDLLGAQIPAFANISAPINTEAAWNSDGTGKYGPVVSCLSAALKDEMIFNANPLCRSKQSFLTSETTPYTRPRGFQREPKARFCYGVMAAASQPVPSCDRF